MITRTDLRAWLKRRPEADQRAQYERWRRTVPFSDAAIAEALEAEAEAIRSIGSKGEHPAMHISRAARAVRAGRLSSWALSVALNRLVLACALCGKKALYRTGCEGRCRDHRYEVGVPEQERRKRFERLATNRELNRAALDTRDLRHQSLHSSKRKMA